MTEQQMIDCLLYELAKKDKLNIRRNNIITFLSIVLMAISILNVALQDHYKSQITESSSGTVEAKAKMLSLWGKIKL